MIAFIKRLAVLPIVLTLLDSAQTASANPPAFAAECNIAVEGLTSRAVNGVTLSMNVSGANPLLIAAWHSEYDGGYPNSWRAMCDGVPGTLLVDTNGFSGGDGNRRFRVYYWGNLTAGPKTIVVTNDFSVCDNELAASAILLTNVALINPIGAIALDTSTRNRTGESETVATAPSDLVVHITADALIVRGTLGSGETSRSVANDGKHPLNGDASLWISTKPGGYASTTVSSSGWASNVLNSVAIVVHGNGAATLDTSAPSLPESLAASAVNGNQINLSWSPATDNIGVTGYLVERQNPGTATFLPVGTTTGTTFQDTGLVGNSSYSYRVEATDGAGNLGGYSGTATATTLSAPSGLVAAYGFEEASGTTAGDVSGNGNSGTLAAGTWTPAGRYGSALSFQGASTPVTINDSGSLHLTTAMTLEAWVSPTTVDGAWRDVIYKGSENYFLMGTTPAGGGPSLGGTFDGANLDLYGAAVLELDAWTHLAGTYDGTAMRLYVNGMLVASRAQTGSLLVSANPLQIGGDSLFGQTFQGQIDEVRVYNRALSASEIQSDMNTPVGKFTTPSTVASPHTLAILNRSLDGHVRLRIDGQANQEYTVEASEDMVAWHPLGTVSSATGGSEFVDSQTAAISSRFYRIAPKP